jgi:hypothetical protein
MAPLPPVPSGDGRAGQCDDSVLGPPHPDRARRCAARWHRPTVRCGVPRVGQAGAVPGDPVRDLGWRHDHAVVTLPPPGRWVIPSGKPIGGCFGPLKPSPNSCCDDIWIQP